MTHEVRVLTGNHAGARLKLAYGLWQIGKEDSADIQISDWEGPSLALQINNDGSVICGGQPLANLQPVQFGETVICVGLSDSAWPSDVALLQRLLAPPTAPVAAAVIEKKRFGSKALRVGAFALTVVGVAGLCMFAVSGAPTQAAVLLQPQAKPMTDAERELARLQTTLNKLHLAEIHASLQNNRLMLGGMVRTAAESQLLTAALNQQWELPVEPHFGVADRMVDDLRSALGERQVSITYLGQGSFKVAGKAQDVDKARATLLRARSDYGASITRIVDELQAAPPSEKKNVNSMLNSDDVQYVELQDGTKDFSNATP